MEQCATRSVKATNPSSKKGLSITSPGIVMGKVWVISRCVMEVGDMNGRPIFTSFGEGQVNPSDSHNLQLRGVTLQNQATEHMVSSTGKS